MALLSGTNIDFPGEFADGIANELLSCVTTGRTMNRKIQNVITRQGLFSNEHVRLKGSLDMTTYIL